MTVRVQDPSLYADRRLVDKGHFVSYWYQIDEIIRVQPKNLLEIGVGNRFLSSYLRERCYDVTTVDFQPLLLPDVVGALQSLPFRDDSFDVVACFEVLEHLPFELFPEAMSELARVARRAIVISVPDAGRNYRVLLRLPKIHIKRIIEFLPQWRPGTISDDGEHYWEIGLKDYPLIRIHRAVEQAGLMVEKTYRIFEYARHRFFVLRKPSPVGQR